MSEKIYFIGIGGSGMSPIALYLAARGYSIHGSDRNRDRGLTPQFFDQLRAAGITLHPQDGSGVTPGITRVVASTAIENTVPDIAAANSLSIPVIHRAQMLAEIFNAARGIAIGGTSGKSSVTGMTAAILHSAALHPTAINGGRMKNFLSPDSPGNVLIGDGQWIIIESDESDGSIINYHPEISVINNISRDHKTIEELTSLFTTFAANTTSAVIVNADCPHASAIPAPNCSRLTFAIDSPADFRAENISFDLTGATFTVNGHQYGTTVTGRHNISNALAAIATATAAGIPPGAIAAGLASFSGIARRFDLIGATPGGIPVYDDFGHNPDKIRATLTMLRDCGAGRIIAVFQPHGFGPTKFMFDDLVAALHSSLRPGDIFIMPEIYYAGGTADKSISSSDIIDALTANGHDARFIPARSAIPSAIAAAARTGDTIVVMGARDDTLTPFCSDILTATAASGK